MRNAEIKKKKGDTHEGGIQWLAMTMTSALLAGGPAD